MHGATRIDHFDVELEETPSPCYSIVKAVIATQPGKELDHSALKQFCEEHLSKHKCPQLIETVEGDLPRNFLGKVLRRRLREQEIHKKSIEIEQTAVTSDVAE